MNNKRQQQEIVSRKMVDLFLCRDYPLSNREICLEVYGELTRQNANKINGRLYRGLYKYTFKYVGDNELNERTYVMQDLTAKNDLIAPITKRQAITKRRGVKHNLAEDNELH